MSQQTSFRFLLVLVAVVLFGPITSAQTQYYTNDTDKKKLLEVVELVKSATTGIGATKLGTLFADAPIPFPNLPASYVDTTWHKALDHFKKMIKNNKVILQSLGGGAATYQRAGINGDWVVLDLTDVNNLTSADPVKRAKAKINLGISIANETPHVFQKLDGGTFDDCDEERDSDQASLIFACNILDAMSMPNGMPHTSLAAITGVKKLAGCLGGLNAAGIAAVHKFVKGEKNALLKRKTMFFDPIVAAGFFDSWVDYYTNGGNRKKKRKVAVIDASRTFTTLDDDDGTSSQNYFVPLGELITNSYVTVNEQDANVLVTSTTDLNGNHILHFWRDADDDGLPEPTEAALPVQLPSPTIDPGPAGVSMNPTNAFGTNGIIIHDTSAGLVGLLELDLITGLPIGAPLLLVQDPILQAPAFQFFAGARILANNDVRIVFSTETPRSQHDFAEAVWIDILAGGGISQSLNPGQTMQDSQTPDVIPGTIGFEIGSPLLGVIGNPGDFFNVTAVSMPQPLPVPPIQIDPGGLFRFVPLLATPIQPNTLYQLGTGNGDDIILVPQSGFAFDNVLVDETNDGVDDRLDLSTDPPRLHLSQGLNPAPIFNHVYELVLEDPNPGFIQSWQPNNRVIETLDGQLDFTLLPGSQPPLYAQSIEDLNGDNNANEAVAIFRPSGQPQFQVDILFNVPFAPFPQQQLQLPLGFVPGIYGFDDVDQNGSLDVCVSSHTGGSSVNLINDGNGNFNLTVGTFPGSGDDLTMTVGVNGQPPTCSGIVNVTGFDVTTLHADSPFGTYLAHPLLVVGQFFTGPVPQFPGFPELYIDPLAAPGPFFLVAGNALTPLGPAEILEPGGNVHTYLIPPGLAGQDLMLQSVVISPQTQNGFFASSDATVMRFN